MLKKLPKHSKLIYLFIYFIFGIQILRIGAIFYPDSYAFLDMAINRSPIYSTFLKCFTSVFGEYYEIPVIITQYVLLILASHFFIKTLYTSFKLHSYSVIVLQIVLLANAFLWYNSINKILSEAIAFPLVLVFITFLFLAVKSKSYVSLYKAVIILFLLQFNRGQFIALIPVVILSILYIMYRTRALKKGVVAIIMVALIPVFISFSERVYNKIVINQYKNYAMTYVHFITAPFYVASSDDVAVFKTEEERDFFTRTFKALESKRRTLELATIDKQPPYMFFEKNFSKICNATVHQYNMDLYAAQGLNEYEQQYKVDEMTTKMFVPLLKANFKKWVKHVRRSFTRGVGGKVIMFLLLMVFFYSFWAFIKTTDYRFLFLTMAITLKFANNLIIAMVVHSIARYTFYFDWIPFVAFIFLFDSLLKKHSEYN